MRPVRWPSWWYGPIGDRLELADARCAIGADEAAEDAAHIGIDRPDRAPERQGGNGAGRVWPDARESLKVVEARWDGSAVLRGDDARRPLEVERAPVVAETAPGAEDIGRRSIGEALDCREGRHEDRPLFGDARDLGLLRHHLRHEDRVRIPLAAERERSPASVVPGKDRRLGLGRDDSDAHPDTIGVAGGRGRRPGPVYNRPVTTNLQVADPLPSVGLRATDGYLLNLRTFVTKQPSLQLFFGGPTLSGAARRRGTKAIEALVSGYERLREAGIAVVAISTDSEEQQAEFAKGLELPFLLMSDERLSAVEVLGIETMAAGANVNVAKPVAIAVDIDGYVRAVLDPVDPETLVDSAIRALSEPIPAATEDASAAQ